MNIKLIGIIAGYENCLTSFWLLDKDKNAKRSLEYSIMHWMMMQNRDSKLRICERLTIEHHFGAAGSWIGGSGLGFPPLSELIRSQTYSW